MEIKDAFKILLTSDGKGKRAKAIVLAELCDTCNPNRVREAVEKFIKENK